MIEKNIDDIQKADIDSLITNAVQERRTIEYKELLPGSDDEAKREFLSDVSSFANASGGDLIYGIRDARDSDRKSTGVPEAALGISGINTNAEILRLEESIRTAIAPRIMGVRLKIIEGFQSGSVIIIRIPQSWNSPHMVTFRNLSRFFSRTSAGKFQLDVHEIRAAFNATASIADRLRQFRLERIGKVIAGQTPVPLNENEGMLILHTVPVSAFQPGAEIDLIKLSNKISSIAPPRSNGWDHYFNLDGHVNFSPIQETGKSRSYVQVFRTGQIEAVGSALSGKKTLPGGAMESSIVNYLKKYIELLRNADIAPPFFILVTFVGMRGCKIFAGSAYDNDGTHAYEEDVLQLPEVRLDSYSTEKLEEQLRPIFNVLWQAFGWRRSKSYDSDGNWIEKT